MRRNSALIRQFADLGRKTRARTCWTAKNASEHMAWRRKFRRKLGQLMGRMPDPVPPSGERVESREFDGFTRHKVYVRSEQHYWVPCFLFVPKRLSAPAPAVVCLHGHSGVYPYIREGTEEQRRQCRELSLDFAPYFAEHGYVTLAPVQRGWDETAQGVDSNETGCQRMVLNSFLTGMTPVGLRCWDTSRTLDYLVSLPEVDASRVGVAGLSGGGMVGLFWAALEPRVKVAMIAGYYCTFRESIFSVYHCLCNCVPGIMQWGDMREVAALIAPRPLLIISGKRDPIFPIQATRRAYRELVDVYEVLDASANLEKDFFDGPHAWSNRKTLPFLRTHLG